MYYSECRAEMRDAMAFTFLLISTDRPSHVINQTSKIFDSVFVQHENIKLQSTKHVLVGGFLGRMKVVAANER